MGLVENIKETAKLIQKIDNLDLYKRILDLQSEVMELVDENRRLKEELRVNTELTFDKNAYWIGTGKPREGPFCSCCWDGSGKLIRLHLVEIDGAVYCPSFAVHILSPPTPFYLV